MLAVLTNASHGTYNASTFQQIKSRTSAPVRSLPGDEPLYMGTVVFLFETLPHDVKCLLQEMLRLDGLQHAIGTSIHNVASSVWVCKPHQKTLFQEITLTKHLHVLAVLQDLAKHNHQARGRIVTNPPHVRYAFAASLASSPKARVQMSSTELRHRWPLSARAAAQTSSTELQHRRPSSEQTQTPDQQHSHRTAGKAVGTLLWLQVGACVNARGKQGVGTVKYVGPLEGHDGIWAGIEFERAEGKHDGSVNGARYFSCAPGHGSMFKPCSLTALFHPHDCQQVV